MFENVRKSIGAKVEAYEASAGVVICLLMAGLFALGAAAIWLAGHIGPVFSSLFFSGVFTILALGFWMFSSAKHGEASHELEVAERKVSQTRCGRDRRQVRRNGCLRLAASTSSYGPFIPGP